MPQQKIKPAGLTRNEVVVLSIVTAGLVIYVAYMLIFTGGTSEKPAGPTREVVVNNAGRPAPAAPSLSSSASRKADDWLDEKKEELAAMGGSPEFEPDIKVYETDDVRIPFRILVKRRNEEEEKKKDLPPDLTD